MVKGIPLRIDNIIRQHQNSKPARLWVVLKKNDKPIFSGIARVYINTLVSTLPKNLKQPEGYQVMIHTYDGQIFKYNFKMNEGTALPNMMLITIKRPELRLTFFKPQQDIYLSRYLSDE